MLFSKLLSSVLFFSLFLQLTFAQIIPPGDEKERKNPNTPKDLNGKILDQILRNKSLVVTAISLLIESRCNQQVTINPFNIIERSRCRNLAADTMKILDYHQEPAEEVTDVYVLRLTFKTKLFELLNSLDANTCLKKVIGDIESRDDFNLYRSFFQCSQNKTTALEYIAVFLQDYSTTKLHYFYVTKILMNDSSKYSELFIKNFELLSTLIDLIAEQSEPGTYEPKYNGDAAYRIVDYFPSNSRLNTEYLRERAYHYYVPSYVTHMLSEKYRYPPAYSYMGGFAFNYFYEIFFVEDLKVFSWEVILQMLSINDPVITDTLTAYDIYMGHEGAFFGLNFGVNHYKHEDFVQKLKTNPSHIYRKIINFLKY